MSCQQAPLVSIMAVFSGTLDMKNFISGILCAALALTLLAGCESTDNKANKVNEPTQVALLFSRPQRPFRIIGGVAANRPHQDPRLGYDSSQMWQDELRRQGAAAGADAVIVNMASLNNINSVLITGTAIRYEKESAPDAGAPAK